MSKYHVRLATLSIVILGVGFLAFGFLYDDPPERAPVQMMRSWQEADAPVGFPVEVTEESVGRTPKFDPRFVRLDAFERFSFPLAPEFNAPMGTESGALVARKEAFGAKSGEKMLLGDRLGGIGGGKDDSLLQVRAVGNGLVLYAGEGNSGQGKVVILGHRMPDGSMLQSFYGSLGRIAVPRGDLVPRGKVIGSVGQGKDGGPLSLHFEFRESDGIELGSYSGLTKQNRLDPDGQLTHHRSVNGATLAPEPLSFRDQPRWEDRLILTNPGKALELFGDD